jgi:hypothetical protein
VCRSRLVSLIVILSKSGSASSIRPLGDVTQL